MGHSYPNFGFDITHSSATSRARLGRLLTPHGVIETPAFVFCATKAALKVATPRQARDAGTQIILSNTYHLMLNPGADTVEALGGLHAMTGWDGPMLTDSGGFQIFSLGHGGAVVGELKRANAHQSRNKSLLKIDEEGATFRSYMDGSVHHLTPEKSIDIQRKLGADLIVVLDECTPMHQNRDYTARSMRMSMRWGRRCLAEFFRGAAEKKHHGRQALYSVSQGGVYPDLRHEYADFMNSEDFFGHAIGGSWGDSKSQMYEILNAAMETLDPRRPTHVLGLGGIDDIFAAVALGGDTFDCVHPTRIARHGLALMRGEPNQRINLQNSRFRGDTTPLSADIPSEVAHLSRGYLHHLFKAGEILGMQILAIHNMAFMNRLLADVRDAIRSDTLAQTQKNWLSA